MNISTILRQDYRNHDIEYVVDPKDPDNKYVFQSIKVNEYWVVNLHRTYDEER